MASVPSQELTFCYLRPVSLEHTPPIASSKCLRLVLGGLRLHDADPDPHFALLDRFVELGGSWVDTAAIYGMGGSERLLGKYRKARGLTRDLLVITKGCVERALVRPELVRRTVQESLGRLDADCLDLFLLHRDDPDVPLDELFDVLEELRADGLLLAYGASNFTWERLRRAKARALRRGIPGFSLSSPHLALATPKEPSWPDCTHALLPELEWCAEVGLRVLGWSPQARGYFVLDELSPDLARVYDTPKNRERKRRARSLAERRGCTVNQVVLAWALAQPGEPLLAVGARDPDELALLYQATSLPLSPHELDWLTASGDRDA